jgi:hypothetical protein
MLILRRPILAVAPNNNLLFLRLRALRPNGRDAQNLRAPGCFRKRPKRQDILTDIRNRKGGDLAR